MIGFENNIASSGNNPSPSVLGKIKIIDANGDVFTNLAEGLTYLQSYIPNEITETSFDEATGTLYFTVPQGSTSRNYHGFCGSSDEFDGTRLIFIDEYGLITIFGEGCFRNNQMPKIFNAPIYIIDDNEDYISFENARNEITFNRNVTIEANNCFQGTESSNITFKEYVSCSANNVLSSLQYCNVKFEANADFFGNYNLGSLFQTEVVFENRLIASGQNNFNELYLSNVIIGNSSTLGISSFKYLTYCKINFGFDNFFDFDSFAIVTSSELYFNSKNSFSVNCFHNVDDSIAVFGKRCGFFGFNFYSADDSTFTFDDATFVNNCFINCYNTTATFNGKTEANSSFCLSCDVDFEFKGTLNFINLSENDVNSFNDLNGGYYRFKTIENQETGIVGGIFKNNNTLIQNVELESINLENSFIDFGAKKVTINQDLIFYNQCFVNCQIGKLQTGYITTYGGINFGQNFTGNFEIVSGIISALPNDFLVTENIISFKVPKICLAQLQAYYSSLIPVFENNISNGFSQIDGLSDYYAEGFEIKTGGVYYGKPVYRKCIDISDGENYIEHNLNIEEYLKHDFILKPYYMGSDMPFVYPTRGLIVDLVNPDVNYIGYDPLPGTEGMLNRLILEYTKTTD